MLIVIAALLSLVAFVVLVRLLWLSARPGRYTTLITLAAIVLVLGLTLLAATGRLHWLAAVGAAVFPFLRRGIGALRYVPLLRALFRGTGAGFGTRGGFGGGSANGAGDGRGRSPSGTDAMTRERALEILGLAERPTRDEIVAAHRRLIQKLHPDRGGSKFLAQQLNEAKARLLEEP